MRRTAEMLRWVIWVTQIIAATGLGVGLVAVAVLAADEYFWNIPEWIVDWVVGVLAVDAAMFLLVVAVGSSACFIEWSFNRILKQRSEK